MRVGTKLASATLGAALVASVGACGATSADGASGADGVSGADATPADAVPHVEPDPQAVELLPAELQQGGTITMAADLHYPPTSFLAEDNKTRAAELLAIWRPRLLRRMEQFGLTAGNNDT